MKDCTTAKVGDKVISRNGKMKGEVLAVGLNYSFPLAIKITEVNGRESPLTAVFRRGNGMCGVMRNEEDFFLAPVRKTVWIRVVRERNGRVTAVEQPFSSREEAESPIGALLDVLPAVEYTYEE